VATGASTPLTGLGPDEALEAYPVGPLVSSVRNEGPALIRPAEGDDAQPGLPLG
jgi:hypothetical protein